MTRLNATQSTHGQSGNSVSANRGVSLLLKRFLDTFAAIYTLTSLEPGDGEDQSQHEMLVGWAAKQLPGARLLWEQIAKSTDPAPLWMNALLIKLLPGIEDWISAPWTRLSQGPVFDNLAGVFTRAVRHLTTWLTDDPLTEAQWSVFELDRSAAREQIRLALIRWAAAIAGNDDPELFQDQLRRAIASKSLPELLDRFDPAMLNEFLTAIYRRVVILNDRHNSAECATFIGESAHVFWDACIEHYRTKKLERICAFGQEILPRLAGAISPNDCDLLKVLPRVLKSFDLNVPNGCFRNDLHSVLEQIKQKQLCLWSDWAIDDEHFRRLLHDAHEHGLRAAITGEFRSVPVRFNLQGRKLHASAVPCLRGRGSKDTLPCTIEDISRDGSGLRLVVKGGNPDVDPTGKNVWFTFGDTDRTTSDVNHCTLELPFTAPASQDADPPKWAVLEIVCQWVRAQRNDTCIGARVVKEHNLKAWAECLQRQFRYALVLA